MRRIEITLIVLSACGGVRAPPPSAPVTVEVAPAAPITSGPLAESPPPNPTPPEREPAPAPAVDGPTTVLVPMPSSGAASPFDRGAAAAALGGAPIQRCLLPGGPTGPGHVTITWDPSGRVSSVAIDQGPFGGTPVGTCLARVYSTSTVPPFGGSPVRVGKSFVLQ